MVHRLDRLTNHAHGVLARVEMDVVFAFLVLKVALLEGRRCWVCWVSRS